MLGHLPFKVKRLLRSFTIRRLYKEGLVGVPLPPPPPLSVAKLYLHHIILALHSTAYVHSVI